MLFEISGKLSERVGDISARVFSSLFVVNLSSICRSDKHR